MSGLRFYILKRPRECIVAGCRRQGRVHVVEATGHKFDVCLNHLAMNVTLHRDVAEAAKVAIRQCGWDDPLMECGYGAPLIGGKCWCAVHRAHARLTRALEKIYGKEEPR